MENEQKETLMSKTEEKVTIGIIIIEIFIGLLAILTIFLPALVSSTESYEGVFATFGGGSNGGIVTQFFDFSFGNFLSYLLVVAAMVIAFLRLAMPKLDTLQAKLVMIGLLAIAGLLFILCRQMTIMHVNVSKDLFKLGVGPLLGMIACILDIIAIGIDIWFARRISLLPAKDDVPHQLTEEELRAQVMAEIEEEKRQEENKNE